SVGRTVICDARSDLSSRGLLNLMVHPSPGPQCPSQSCESIFSTSAVVNENPISRSVALGPSSESRPGLIGTSTVVPGGRVPGGGRPARPLAVPVRGYRKGKPATSLSPLGQL